MDIWNYFLLKQGRPTPTNCPINYTPKVTAVANAPVQRVFPANQRVTLAALDTVFGQINGVYLITIATLNNTIFGSFLATTLNGNAGYQTRILKPLVLGQMSGFYNANILIPFNSLAKDFLLLPSSIITIGLSSSSMAQCEITCSLLASW